MASVGAGPQSRALFERARKVTPGGVHSPVRAFGHVGGEPLFIESASGATIVDADGRHYTDYCQAFGPLILGHRHPDVQRAAEQALHDGWSFGAAERYSLELAEHIQARIPDAERIRFVNSGTEAVMTAVRLARACTGRARIIKFAGCYHGHSDSMLVEAGSGMAGVAMSAGITAGTAGDTWVLPLDDEAALRDAFAAHADDIAGVIIEPLPANYGLLPQRQAFLELARSLCSTHSAVLIFDEVITGFRIGFGGYAEHSGITPDLFTWGKIIGGGFPVGAVAGSARLLDQLSPSGGVYQAGTLSANPVAMRAGLANLNALADGTVYERLEQLGSRLEAGLAELQHLSVVRAGSLFWLCGRSGARTAAAYETHCLATFAELFAHLLEADIYIAPSPYEVGFLSAAHTEADIDALIRACATWSPTSGNSRTKP